MKIIGIIGTRRRDDRTTYDLILQKFIEIYQDGDWICSGGCPEGGDRFAELIAKRRGIPILIFWPRWNNLEEPGAVIRYDRSGKPYNAAAGYARDTKIAYCSDVIIASVAPDRKGGTEDTLKKYIAAGKNIIYIV